MRPWGPVDMTEALGGRATGKKIKSYSVRSSNERTRQITLTGSTSSNSSMRQLIKTRRLSLMSSLPP